MYTQKIVQPIAFSKIFLTKKIHDSPQCRNVPPATEKYTTTHMVAPTMRITEDICPYSRKEVTIKTNTDYNFYYVSWKHYLILMYMYSKSMQRTKTSK